MTTLCCGCGRWRLTTVDIAHTMTDAISRIWSAPRLSPAMRSNDCGSNVRIGARSRDCGRRYGRTPEVVDSVVAQLSYYIVNEVRMPALRLSRRSNCCGNSYGTRSMKFNNCGQTQGAAMGRILPFECGKCDGVIGWGDFGPSGGDDEFAHLDAPTCTCVMWVRRDGSWEPARSASWFDRVFRIVHRRR